MKQKLQNLKYLLFVNLFSLVGYYVFTPFYAIFARNFGITPKSIGLIWSVYSLVTALFILVMGKLENHRNKSRMAVAGYFICSLGSLSFLLVHSEPMLIAVLMLNALGAGVMLPAYKTLFASNKLKGRESEQWSWLDAGNMAAAAAGAGIGGLVIGAFGFKGLFITMAAIQFVAALVALKVFSKK